MSEEAPEYQDEAKADYDGRHQPKPSSAAPHYLRCTWYKEERRCRLSEGHSQLAHEYIKE